MLRLKAMALSIGVMMGSLYMLLQTSFVSGDAHTIGETLIATTLASVTSYSILRERLAGVRRGLSEHKQTTTERFDTVETKLDETQEILRALTGQIGELVGEARARRQGAVLTRSNDP